MVEEKIAVVPRVVVAAAFGPKHYGVLLTDTRMIFVLEKVSRAEMGAVLGGVIGAVLADATAKKSEFVYADANPEALAKIEKSIVIPNASVRRVKMKAKLGGAYTIRLDYADEAGKERKLTGILSPPDEQVSARRANGEKLNVILRDYAVKAQNAFKMVLPLGAAQESEWV